MSAKLTTPVTWQHRSWIVCSTDAHSTRGLANMPFSVATARRGWATAADVLNTRPLRSLPRRGR